MFALVNIAGMQRLDFWNANYINSTKSYLHVYI